MLKIDNICKTFNPGTINEKRALNGVTLHLKDGESVAVIGGNGAGKSTLLNAVAGVWPVDSGTISIGGVDVTGLPEHKRAKYIGRVFQDPMMGTAATMQIEENLALAARRGQKRTLRPGITKKEREHYRELLKVLDLGLEDRMTVKVGLLSGGQRQALTLLMASLVKPKLLLLDEHTAALDPKTAAKVMEVTRLIVNRDRLTTLMITHNMRDAIEYGDRLIMMYEGRIALDIAGEEKQKLTVEDLLAKFGQATGSSEADDQLLLG
ncbi:MAG TPA: ABC transporter ATP-binding protein [Candidatus Galloscillospira excrementavium]|nr:ABC transporter ATP-binding protein [Candidatus Galloscillospira excrementavium]